MPRLTLWPLLAAVLVMLVAGPGDAHAAKSRGRKSGSSKQAAAKPAKAPEARPETAPIPANATPDIVWRFELQPGAGPAVHVRATFRGDPDGETTLGVTREWGGIDNGGDDIFDLVVSDSSGATLDAERHEPNQWRVRHARGAPLTVRYALRANAYQVDPSPRVNRRPILNARLMHFYGELALVRPGHLDDGVLRIVAFEWAGFEEAGWKVAHSFAVTLQRSMHRATLADVRESVYMAGDIRILRREVRERPVWCALAGDGWSFTDEAFADLAGTIVGMEREFFQDFDYPYYLITVIPVGVAQPGSRSLGGTGLTQSFSVAMMPDTGIEDHYGGGFGLPTLLAHEMFHQWNGRIIRPGDPEELAYWFSEGFTNFYARRLLRKAGLMTAGDFATSVNHALAEFHLSPARNEPNERIRAAFWSDRAVGDLPYRRGDIVAMILDRQIRRVSKGRRSLDDFMRDLVADGRAGTRVTTDSLLSRIARETGADSAERIRKIVVDGMMPELPADTFAPCHEIRVDSLGIFDLGFDFEASREARVVRGLVAGSAAELAGLREGDVMAGWSLENGNAARPVTLKVKRDRNEHEITWLPVGGKRPVPQLQRRPDAGEDCGR